MEKNTTNLLNKLRVALYSGDDCAENTSALDEMLLSFWWEEICENAPMTSEEFEKAEADCQALANKLEVTLNEEQKALLSEVLDKAVEVRILEGDIIFLNSIKMGMRLGSELFGS